MAIRANSFAWQLPLQRDPMTVPPRLVWAVAIVVALAGMIAFPLRSATVLREKSIFRAEAARVNAIVPADETLYAVDPRFQPYLLYIAARVRYLPMLAELPPDARYFVVHPDHRDAVSALPTKPRLLLRTNRFRGRETLLFTTVAR
jgi:hypothetical protein